jgi:hypothetical protein
LSFKPISKTRIGYDCSCSSALFDVVLFLWIRCRWLCVWLLHCEGRHGHRWYRDCQPVSSVSVAYFVFDIETSSLFSRVNLYIFGSG